MMGAMSRALVAVIVVGALVPGCGDDAPSSDGGLCAAKHLAPWLRAPGDAGSAVTFNEVMYHPAPSGPEWIELWNPLAIDLDLSGWRLDGAVAYTFPEGTGIPADGFTVVAGEVFAGALPDDRGTLELWNNAGRLIDAVSYADLEPWPVGADGSGASLAKPRPGLASDRAESWAVSATVGGTPGAPNLVAASPEGLAFDEVGDGWVELVARGAAPVELASVELVSSAGATWPLPAGLLAPGERVVVETDAQPGAVLLLRRAAAILDGVRVVDVPRARDGTDDTWRYPDVATPGAPNQITRHDELVVSEVLYHAPPVVAPDGTIGEDDLEWIELHNRSAAPVDASGYQLVDAIAYEVPAGTTIPADGYLVVTNDLAAMRAAYPDLAAIVVGNFAGGLADRGDRIELRDACANSVDVVTYRDGGGWPALADGGGSSLELRNPDTDRGAPAAWAASDETAGAVWQTIAYEGVATASAVGPDGAWQELVIGLLDEGVVLLDDVSVTVDGTTELVGGGTFEAGASGFRALGNHRHAEVVVDPTDPANHVLRVAATGPTEHMHNHLETTLTGGHRITNGRRYRISLRARWQGGSELLNTRLYFNRLARTTALARPGHPGTPGRANRAAVANLGPSYRELRHAPTVPRPDQPVEVSVAASDPDGLAGLVLWTAVDGAAPTATPMTLDGTGRYTATAPGHPAATVVQFWIAGADARGASASFPAAGPDARALWQVDDGRAATNGLHNLRIVVRPDDTTWLFTPANLMSNDLIGVTVVDGERDVYYDVGLRLKSSERGRPEAARVGFAVRFDPAQPFRGAFPSVLIDRSQGVGFGQRELLLFQAMNHAGSVVSQYDDLIQLLAPRPDLTGPAHLQLARFGSQYLDGQFADGGDGALFEYELVYYPTTTDTGTPTGAKLPQPDSVVGVDLRDLGDDEEAYRQTFLVKNARWRDDYRGFIRFARAMGQRGPAFDDAIADVIDVDQWLRALAFASLSGAIDNYASGAQHNADFFVRPSDGRVLYFPHDLDFLGSSRGTLVASPDLARLIAVPARARAYYGHLHDLVTTSFNGRYLAPWSDQLGRLLPGQDFAGHLAYIADRAAYAAGVVDNAVPRVFFRLTTTDRTVDAASVTLDGVGWVDLDRVTRDGTPLALTWISTTAWQATVALGCGANPITLAALDRHGASLGTGAVVVTRSGAGCP